MKASAAFTIVFVVGLLLATTAHASSSIASATRTAAGTDAKSDDWVPPRVDDSMRSLTEGDELLIEKANPAPPSDTRGLKAETNDDWYRIHLDDDFAGLPRVDDWFRGRDLEGGEANEGADPGITNSVGAKGPNNGMGPGRLRGGSV